VIRRRRFRNTELRQVNPIPQCQAKPWSRELRVQVVDDEIIVTLPGFRYSVTYYKPHKSPQLMAKNIASEDDLRSHDGLRVLGDGVEAR
jgi:hypothetical protein